MKLSCRKQKRVMARVPSGAVRQAGQNGACAASDDKVDRMDAVGKVIGDTLKPLAKLPGAMRLA